MREQQLFYDHREAGKTLASSLLDERGPSTVVVGLPGAGMLVAGSVAEALGAPLEEWGCCERPLCGCTVVVVGEGIESAENARSIARTLRTDGPRRLVLGIPVGASAAVEELASEFDAVICLTRAEVVPETSAWYQNAPAADGNVVAAREHALSMHDEIRAKTRRVLALAGRVMHADHRASQELTEAMKELAYAVRRHVAAEQTELTPLLDRLDRWGEDRKKILSDAHGAEIDAVFNVEYYGSDLAMAEDASSIAHAIFDALLREERTVLATDLLTQAAEHGLVDKTPGR